ncbi:hypothetical protein T10_11412 [Trichinella papuae]|uniref:Uncharacterized protein n=1 Tax=Trichinella papuae TaxID=268474 RepID=A0A0V1LY18_9BILA|nr:hypothetical protein T10_11412 [Trichinella papuae]
MVFNQVGNPFAGSQTPREGNGPGRHANETMMLQVDE